MTDWQTYYDRSHGRPISPLLAQALAAAGDRPGNRMALDLGCGAGNECRTLLEANWRVHALDREQAAIDRVHTMMESIPGSALTAEVCAFEDIVRLPSASLIHAGLSLPFCHPSAFPRFWQVAMTALEPGGWFAGHFFGPRDAWAHAQTMTFHSATELHGLFANWQVLDFQETEGMGPSLRGPKYWHRFAVIARKPAASA